MKATLEADRSSALNEATKGSIATNTPVKSKIAENDQLEKLSCELKVTQSIEALQRSALQQLGSTTEQVHASVVVGL